MDFFKACQWLQVPAWQYTIVQTFQQNFLLESVADYVVSSCAYIKRWTVYKTPTATGLGHHRGSVPFDGTQLDARWYYFIPQSTLDKMKP